MTGAVVGRDALLEGAWSALRRPGIVLLEGAAGIGKTSVLRTLVERARSDGMRVLDCGPTEIEQALPLAAVADVLHSVSERVDSLPLPQRAAAHTAMLASAGDQPVDERALGVALRSLIEEAANDAQRGLLVAIDDSHWLDPPSERALRFVLRRLDSRVALLVSRRTQPDEAAPAPLGLDETGLTRIALQPLGIGPLHHLLTSRFDVPLSRPLLTRVATDSGGNPLLAIEMVRAVLRLPALPRQGEDLPVVLSLQELVGATLTGLSAQSRSAVQLAALLTSPTLSVLSAAGVEETALDLAEESGLVHVDRDGVVGFVHPVYAAAVRAEMPTGRRRRLHRQLAEVCGDPDERARQLARGAIPPDQHAAEELAAAAARARARGAPELAMDLYDRAAELMPPANEDARLMHRLAAVRCRYDSGDYSVAGAEADELVAMTTGDDQAEALLLRAEIAWSADDVTGALDAATRALEVAGPDSVLAGRIHVNLAAFVEDPERACIHAEAALRLLERGTDAGPGMLDTDERDLLVAAHLTLFLHRIRAGHAPRMDLLDRALELENGEPSRLAGTIPAIWWKAVDDHERARGRLSAMVARALALGDEPFQHEVLCHLGEAETLAGRYADAERWIGEARILGEQLVTGLASESWLRGMLDASRGDLAAADRAAEEGLREAVTTGDAWRRRISLQLSAFSALVAGRSAEAAASYAALADAVDETRLVEPLSTRFEADWVEACVGIGDLESAARAHERLAARHDRLPRPWTALGLARSRVLLAAARGEPVDGPLAALAAALEAVPVDVVPLDRARCLLVAGIAHRRARRKRPAREALDAAASEFDALGARAHAETARAELARIGGRPATPLELTVTEERVARLAAAGHTNRSIADAIFVSPKTVEANLARVYRKLGIARRTELAAAMGRVSRAAEDQT